jgi:hypothetical protein
MRLSWTSLKISIAGAKLSHLVQKDKIWDHGSMTEQARIIFYLVQKAKNNENIESLKKYMTISCFEKLKMDMNKQQEDGLLKEPVIKELAVMQVHPGKSNRPDMFTAFMKGVAKCDATVDSREKEFLSKWSFVRQGDWWMLDEIHLKKPY